MNKIMYNIAQRAVKIGLGYIYNYLDKNDDGTLSRDEIIAFAEFVVEKIKSIKKK